jgi:hypothetical protein
MSPLDSLTAIYFLELYYAMGQMTDIASFLSHARYNPTIYLARYQAELVPQVELKRTLGKCLVEVQAVLDALQLPVNKDTHLYFKRVDDVIGSTAFYAALIQRYNSTHKEKIEVKIFDWVLKELVHSARRLRREV